MIRVSWPLNIYLRVVYDGLKCVVRLIGYQDAFGWIFSDRFLN